MGKSKIQISGENINKILTGINSVTGILKRNANGTFEAAQGGAEILSGDDPPTGYTVGNLHQLYVYDDSIYVCTDSYLIPGSTTMWYVWENTYKEPTIPASSATTAEILVSDWDSNKEATVYCYNMTSTANVVVTPRPTDYDTWCESGIRCTGQGSNQLSFKCNEVPGTYVIANVLVVV